MFISTKKLTEDEHTKLKNFLSELGISFINQEKNVQEYRKQLRQEYEEMIEITNQLNNKSINLFVKSAIPQEWIGNETVLSFIYSASIEDYSLDEENIELVNDELLHNGEEIEDVLNHIKENLVLEYDYTFSQGFDRFEFDSEQEKIHQIF